MANKGVSAAEKYAELEARGEERPRCECHGKQKNWHMDYRNEAAGGHWSCSVKDNERRRKRYANDTKYRERQLRQSRDQRRERYANDLEYRSRTRERVRLNGHKLRSVRISSGLCAVCGKAPLVTAGAWRCNGCLDKRLSPLELLKARRRKALARQTQRQTGRMNGEISPQE